MKTKTFCISSWALCLALLSGPVLSAPQIDPDTSARYDQILDERVATEQTVVDKTLGIPSDREQAIDWLTSRTGLTREYVRDNFTKVRQDQVDSILSADPVTKYHVDQEVQKATGGQVPAPKSHLESYLLAGAIALFVMLSLVIRMRSNPFRKLAKNALR